jgi:glycosyltransferase involved in cell wall biosynthesis
MCACKIYLFTYKRNQLLPRAVESLISQTFTDWCCELHNDFPEDPFPAAYLHKLNDPRFTLVNHQHNLGGTASFNLAFKKTEAAYMSILEDDNWWEPDFLQEMIGIMEANPDLQIAWSNMWLWKEEAHNQWINTGQTIWPENGPDEWFNWPNDRQLMGALHSNGAMLCRGAAAGDFIIPDDCDFSIIEGVRERTFHYPIYLCRKPLAHFSLTLNTSRTTDTVIWNADQVMLLASFVQAAPYPPQSFKTALAHYRPSRPSPVAIFFLANVLVIKSPALYACFTTGDWIVISRWLIKNVRSILKLKKQLKKQAELYTFLLKKTKLLNRKIITKPVSIEP